MSLWDDFLTPRDRQVFTRAGYGTRAGFGQRPVVLVIDVNYNFVGDRPEPIEQSVLRWRTSCGEEGWQAAERIARLLEGARSRRVPVIYSTGIDSRPDGFDRGRWSDKSSRSAEAWTVNGESGNTIIPPIAPRPEDIVIAKSKPSVFFARSWRRIWWTSRPTPSSPAGRPPVAACVPQSWTAFPTTTACRS